MPLIFSFSKSDTLVVYRRYIQYQPNDLVYLRSCQQNPTAPVNYEITNILLILVLNTADKTTKLSTVGNAAPRCHL